MHPSPSLLFLANPNLLALATPASLPPSPIYSGQLGPSPPARYGASEPPFNGASDPPRRFVKRRLIVLPLFALVAWRGVPWRFRRHRRSRCRGAAVPDCGGAGAVAPPWLGLAWCCCAFGVCRRGRHGRALRFTSPVSIHRLLLSLSALLTSLLILFVLLSHWPASPC